MCDTIDSGEPQPPPVSALALALAKADKEPPAPPRPARAQVGGLCRQLMAAEASKAERDEKRKADQRERYRRHKERQRAIAEGLPVPPVLKPHEVRKAKREAKAAEEKAKVLAWIAELRASRGE